MNQTILRFGYPETLVAAFDHWVLLLRPEQPTLGSLILAARSEALAFGDLPPAAFAELAKVTEAIERALTASVSYEKLNYLMLMMVDPHVHFHVIPRYGETRTFADIDFPDNGWPRAPQLSPAVALSADAQAELIALLKESWP